MKKRKLREPVKNVLAVVSFYAILILGVVAINARFETINEQQKSANEGSAQIAQIINR